MESELLSNTEAPDWFLSRPFRIIQADASEALKRLPFKIDCIMTSPPYFKQRSYGESQNEIGIEGSVQEYIASLVRIFQAVPPHPWGSVWINLGDKRGSNGELLGIPEQFVAAMDRAGFHLIDKVIWAKEAVRIDGTTIGRCMMEPANKRLNGNGFEPMFRFVRNPKEAWTDTAAVRIPRANVEDQPYLPKGLMTCHTSVEGRNLSNVWLISAGKTNLPHYAVFPDALVERPVAMTCPLEITAEGPRERQIKPVPYDEKRAGKRNVGKYTQVDPDDPQAITKESGRHDTGSQYVARKPVTMGWSHPDLPSHPGIVLDPFAGTGTTGVVAIKLGRRFIGIELYPENVAIAVERCEEAVAIRDSVINLTSDVSRISTDGTHSNSTSSAKVEFKVSGSRLKK